MGPQAQRFEMVRLLPAAAPEEDDAGDFAREVAAGLARRPKTLPCRFFYDAQGSRLFEEICTLPEYYVTRAEREILEAHGDEIAARLGESIELIELGSGSAEKTEVLLERLRARGARVRYLPVDICGPAIEASAERLLARFEGLEVVGIEAEYVAGLEGARARSRGPRVALFLGGNLGNFERVQAARFLGRLRASLGPRDRLLLGLDLRKEREVLERAYDDARGVTARFNLNLLARINRELGGGFDLDAFAHRALWRPDRGAVEMHLVSLRRQRVPIAALGRAFDFEEGESIHTEDSFKFSIEELDQLARAGGWRREETWLDSGARFSLSLLAADERPAAD